MRTARPYWFPAKKYGWGWGMPAVWQGKVVLGGFFALVGVGAYALLPRYGPVPFLGYCTVLCLLLVLICWLKGEPPDTAGQASLIQLTR